MNAFTRFASNDFVRLGVLYAALIGLVVAGAAQAAPETPDTGPVYNAGNQYTAVYHQARSQWQILPATGQDLAIEVGACGANSILPLGVWLVSRDDQGRVQLVAPSTTVLAAGQSDTIAVRACDQADAGALALPQPLIDLLASETGAVLVDE